MTTNETGHVGTDTLTLIFMMCLELEEDGGEAKEIIFCQWNS